MVVVEAKTSAAEKGLMSVSNLLKKVSGDGRGLQDVFAGVLGANLLQQAIGGLRNLGVEAVRSYASYERLGMSLQSLAAREALSSGAARNMAEAMEMSAGRAKDLLGWTQQLAIKSPFTQSGVASAFRMAQAYGFTSKEAQRLTQAMIDFAAGSGASEDTMGRIALALGQVRAAGKLTGMEMRQLTEAGLPVTQILADAFGMTTEQVIDLREKGLIPAKQAIEAIVQALERDFGGAAARQSETFAGLISSLQDIKDIGLREFFEGTADAIRPLMTTMVEAFQTREVQQRIKELGAAFGEFVADVVSRGKDVVTWFSGLSDGVRKAAVGFAGLVVLRPMLFGLFADIASGLSLAVKGFSAAATALRAYQSGLTLTSALGAAGMGTLGATAASLALQLAPLAAVFGALYAGQKIVTDEFERQAQAVRATATSYTEYAAQMENLAAKYGMLIDAEGNLYRIRGEYMGQQAVEIVRQQWLMNDATWQGIEAQRGMNDVAQQGITHFGDLRSAMDELAASQANKLGVTQQSVSVDMEAAMAAQQLVQAEREAAQAIIERATAQTQLAMEWVKPQDVDLARQALADLGTQMQNGQITAEQYKTAVQNIGLEFGLMSPQSIALAENFNILTAAIGSGVIPLTQSDEAIKALRVDAADGSVDMYSFLTSMGATSLEASNLIASMGSAGEGVKVLGRSAGESKEAFTGSMKTVTDSAKTTADSVVKSLTTPDWKGTGTKIGSGILDGVKPGFTDTGKAAETLGKKIWTELDKDWSKLGSKVGTGFKQGLLATQDEAFAAARAFVNQLNAIFAKIQYPSFGGWSGGGVPSYAPGTSTSNENRPQRALGGFVYKDEAVLVGERGPELFLPPSDGWIVSNRDSKKLLAEAQGGTTMVTYENHFYYRDSSLTESELDRIMERMRQYV